MPGERELPRSGVERRTLEQQADSEIPAQRDREVPSRHAIRPLFDLTNDTCPPAQGQELGAEIPIPLLFGHTKRGQGVFNRVERRSFRGVIFRHEPRE
jgi:hypothetical protein